ncbi:MAG: DNA-binding protein [Streptococcaceae bacterium]|jgi:predicted RNA-binding protein (virulence factor B family)|nr:DNA-binding protein [Streptococcaceae bacterium]
MENLFGQVITGLVTDENEKQVFVQKSGITFALDKSEGAFKLGDVVSGFAYIDKKHKNVLTTEIPQISATNFVWGAVTGTRRDVGVFVDVGIKNKDIVVSLDELPELRELWPKVGDKLLVNLTVDDKKRFWGHLATEDVFHSIGHFAKTDLKNQEVTATVYRLKLVGSFAITSDNYLAFIHPSERFKEPRLGEVVTARVIGVGSHGLLNLSLKPLAHKMIDNDAEMILAYLTRQPSGLMTLNDKSAPEEIKQLFGISKAQFKRALGSLMKQKKIIQGEFGTKLSEQGE